VYLEGAAFNANSLYQKPEVMVADKNGAIWFNLLESTTGFGNSGLVKLKEDVWTEFNTGNSEIPGDKVNAIAFDSNNAWVGTDMGLAMFDGISSTGWTIYKTAQGLPADNVTALAVDSKDTVWIGFASGKIYKLKNGTIASVGEVTAQAINCLFADKNDNIWIGLNASTGAKKGIAKYNAGQILISDCPNSVTSFAQISNGTIYASSLNGIYSNASGNWVNDFPSGSFYKLSADKDDLVWVSSNDTIYCIGSGKLKVYSSLNSGVPATGNVVLTKAPVTEDSEGKKWFAYYKSANAALANFSEADEVLNVLSDTLINFCSGSEVALDAGDGFVSYYWNNGHTSQTIKSTSDSYYNVSVKDNKNCYYYDSIHTWMQVPFHDEELCVVTVNPEDSTNLIVWKRTDGKGTESFNIYKETGNANEYAFLANLPFSDLSVYVDEDSEPAKQSNRYKISVVDSCGNESDLSREHKTLHLTINLGIEGAFNLIWENYEGIDFSQYKIYRGLAPDNMEQIGVSPSNLTTYTDNPPPGTYYYQLGIVLPQVCAPANLLKASAGPYSEAVSNMEKKLKSSGTFVSLASTDGVSVYPTYFKESLTINTGSLVFKNVKTELANLSGNVLFEGFIEELAGQYKLIIPSLPDGVYIIRLSGDNLNYTSKLICKSN